jgi:MFS family permease
MSRSPLLDFPPFAICLNAASYGVAFFLPTIIKGFGVSDTQTGMLSALPFVFGAIGMVLLGRHSDRTMERKGHAPWCCRWRQSESGCLESFPADHHHGVALLCTQISTPVLSTPVFS